MTTKFDVSIVIPAFNSCNTLLESLHSLLPISSIVKEILVIDNGSTDDTKEICKNFPVRYVFEPRRGRSMARNRGLQEVSTEFIIFMDADVIMPENWIEPALSCLVERQWDAVQGPIKQMGHRLLDDFRLRHNFFKFRQSHFSLAGSFDVLPCLNTSLCLWRTEFLQLIGGFDEWFVRFEDTDLTKRALLHGASLGSIQLPDAHVYWHGGWLSYMKRAFLDGFYERRLFERWNVPEAEKRKAAKEICANVLKAGRERLIMWLLLALVDSARGLGQLFGSYIGKKTSAFDISQLEPKLGKISVSDEIKLYWKGSLIKKGKIGSINEKEESTS